MPYTPTYASLLARLSAELKARAFNNTLRREYWADGLADFSSNDYLGLASDPILRASVHAQLELLPSLGSTGSRLLTGHSPLLAQTEAAIAAYHGAESALLFPSGYQANVGLLAGLLRRTDTVYFDADCHASLRDGLRLAGCRAIKWPHNDLETLRRQLREHDGTAQPFVLAESLYSMAGDAPPLPELVTLCRETGAQLLLDEAHAVGVLGPQGRGLAQTPEALATGIDDVCLARVLPFGKALGLQGAAIVGSQTLRDYLLNHARPQIYSTAPAPLLVVALLAAYELLPTLDDRRAQLRANYDALLAKIAPVWPPDELYTGPGAILGLGIRGNEACRTAASRLRTAGLDVRAILAPTVMLGTERLRVNVHSFNTPTEIDQLDAALHDLVG